MGEPKKINKHLYSDNVYAYINAGYSVIPDKYMSKQPAIKGWSNYCHKLPTKDEVESWIRNFEETNIAVCLGEASGIIALDIDTDDPKLLEIILPVLPPSPVTKQGAKGITRFFRYNGESTQIVKHNGECILELLSTNKKTTIAPSVHPNGMEYTWVSDSLLDVKAESLPLLPPFLISHIESKLRLSVPDTVSISFGKTISGRNNILSAFCGELIRDGVPVDEAIKKLIEKDKQDNSPHLFSDTEEMGHTEAFTNALVFYSNHLSTVNSRHFKKNEEYEIPITASAIDHEAKEMVRLGKSRKQENVKKLKRVLPPAQGVLKDIQDNILQNSFIPQPDFAFSASLILLGTLIGRKFVFQGMASNLYILNIAPSGSGKDAPQQKIKEYLSSLGCEYLLGAGDYVSDASLMDSLGTKPVRLDIMDEAGGILKTVSKGKSEYNGKMADILAELYTSSNARYLGRATAEGTKGACARPNVSILASTTPTGFSEGISLKSIEKGLMGRFLTFVGTGDKPAQRVKTFTNLSVGTLTKLRWFAGYKPEESDATVAGIKQLVHEIQSTEEADAKLDNHFNEFDSIRRSCCHTDPMLPIIARLYQQMIKIIMIHSASRCKAGEMPVINDVDVQFGYKTIMYYFDTIKEVVKEHIHEGQADAIMQKFISLIRSSDGISKSDLVRRTRYINKRTRDDFLSELADIGDICVEIRAINGRNQQFITYIGE